MNIAIIGASGKAGKRIAKEAADRGHTVTALVRDAGKLGELGIPAVEKDIFQLQSEDLRPYDVIVNAFGTAPGQEHLHGEAGRSLIAALQGAPNTRLIVVGGAGSLFVDEAETIRLLDTTEFPKAYYAVASNQTKNLEDLQRSEGINWTFLSPSAFFDPDGKRTGTYRKGGNRLLVNAQGNSYVSYADYAIALVDEIEKPQHANERFTVVSEAE
ncbi:NAD(P)-dependent oxidoreductase [Paenibacillus hodogayensis]|uniref:NAD(P)-dependent oxidoreductase n=1 Tax=Paenibacillus hodogayensis TaxID=279208 RepID=A0ABV5W0V6_9BACL